MPLNVVFMGTPEIASESLRSVLLLAESGVLDLKCVYTKPPTRSVKKMCVVKSSVHLVADKFNIKVKTPKTLRNNIEEIEFLKSLSIDLIIVTAFGVILPDVRTRYSKVRGFKSTSVFASRSKRAKSYSLCNIKEG